MVWWELHIPMGYTEFECEKCGCVIQDAEMNAEYNERYNPDEY